jgi:hypothetical protein
MSGLRGSEFLLRSTRAGPCFSRVARAQSENPPRNRRVFTSFRRSLRIRGDLARFRRAHRLLGKVIVPVAQGLRYANAQTHPPAAPPARGLIAMRLDSRSTFVKGETSKGMTAMIDEKLVRLRTHRNNISRYRRLLKTNLSAIERQFIEMRMNEEKSAMKGLAVSTFPVTLKSTEFPPA